MPFFHLSATTPTFPGTSGSRLGTIYVVLERSGRQEKSKGCIFVARELQRGQYFQSNWKCYSLLLERAFFHWVLGLFCSFVLAFCGARFAMFRRCLWYSGRQEEIFDGEGCALDVRYRACLGTDLFSPAAYFSFGLRWYRGS